MAIILFPEGSWVLQKWSKGRKPTHKLRTPRTAQEGFPAPSGSSGLPCTLQAKVRVQAGGSYWRGRFSFHWRFNRNIFKAALRFPEKNKTTGCFSSWQKRLLKRDRSKCFQNGRVMFLSCGACKETSGMSKSWRNSPKALDIWGLFLCNLLIFLY